MPANASAADLAQAMLEYDVRSIPIVDESTVVGIVSRRDLLRLLVRRDDLVATEVRRVFDEHAGEFGSDGHRWDAEVADGVVTVTGPFAPTTQTPRGAQGTPGRARIATA